MLTPFLKHLSGDYAEVKQTPRGSVVVFGGHLLTDEVDPEDATALAMQINSDIIDKQARRIIAACT